MCLYQCRFEALVVHVFVFVSMVGRCTIGNKFWIMAQPSLHQGQHRPIVLLRQEADDDNAFACLLVFISKRNNSTLTTLHSFMRKDLKKSKFLSNLNALAWYGSYKIWLTRDDPNFADPPFLISHI